MSCSRGEGEEKISYKPHVVHVAGTNKGNVFLFALSTCAWCRRTKALLTQLDVAYDYVDVDQLEGEARTQATSELKAINPSQAFPTMLVNGEPLIGFQEERLRELFDDEY